MFLEIKFSIYLNRRVFVMVWWLRRRRIRVYTGRHSPRNFKTHWQLAKWGFVQTLVQVFSPILNANTVYRIEQNWFLHIEIHSASTRLSNYSWFYKLVHQFQGYLQIIYHFSQGRHKFTFCIFSYTPSPFWKGFRSEKDLLCPEYFALE